MPENNLKHYYIVKEHPVRIISKCKSHSKGTLLSFLVGFCALYAVMNWIPEILSVFFPATNADLFSAYIDADPAVLRQLPKTSLVVFVYAFFFSGVFKLSECLYTLTYIRNRKADYIALSESLNYYFKTFGLYALQTLVIAFWSMFLIIPGIMAAFNFSQAYYILADDPEKSITQVLAESKIMMYGNRMNYLRLLIYYIPYVMLAYIPAFILAALISGLQLPQAAVMAISFISDIPVFVAMGLVSMGKCVFYELMINQGFAKFRYAGQDAFRELEKTDRNSEPDRKG